VYNEPNEKATLTRFIKHLQEAKPFIITSFNGDFFDWPFVEARMNVHGLHMTREIGISNNSGEYYGRFALHLDCFPWVKRDSYLPQGSHGLKAVTKKKLYYDPIEVDPELMVPFARERPKVLCNYSVSDAVATYFLYKKHIHDFIFALCTIIPLGPDDVLRRGSGTLCELLLMAEAYTREIIFPNKKSRDPESFYNGHLID
jgi:DNA polymerase epsilon subunit 1